jgi:hypothetical protein
MQRGGVINEKYPCPCIVTDVKHVNENGAAMGEHVTEAMQQKRDPLVSMTIAIPFSSKMV